MFNKYGADPSGLPDHMKKRYKPEHFKQEETAPERETMVYPVGRAPDTDDDFTEMSLKREDASSINKQIELL